MSLDQEKFIKELDKEILKKIELEASPKKNKKSYFEIISLFKMVLLMYSINIFAYNVIPHMENKSGYDFLLFFYILSPLFLSVFFFLKDKSESKGETFDSRSPVFLVTIFITYIISFFTMFSVGLFLMALEVQSFMSVEVAIFYALFPVLVLFNIAIMEKFRRLRKITKLEGDVNIKNNLENKLEEFEDVDSLIIMGIKAKELNQTAASRRIDAQINKLLYRNELGSYDEYILNTFITKKHNEAFNEIKIESL